MLHQTRIRILSLCLCASVSLCKKNLASQPFCLTATVPGASGIYIQIITKEDHPTMNSKARKMLNDWEAPYIQALVRQIESQSKVTLANWALDYATLVLLPLWTKHCPQDQRPERALLAAREWLAGSIKLPAAKQDILACHTAARETGNNPVALAAARAIGQSASTIHSAKHCIGLALYGALAVAYDSLGTNASWADLEQQAALECARMLAALQAVSVADEPHPAKISWVC